MWKVDFTLALTLSIFKGLRVWCVSLKTYKPLSPITYQQITYPLIHKDLSTDNPPSHRPQEETAADDDA